MKEQEKKVRIEPDLGNTPHEAGEWLLAALELALEKEENRKRLEERENASNHR